MRHEGFRADFYKCSAGKKTIGYGRNVDDNPFSFDEQAMLGRDCFVDEPMTKAEAEIILRNEVRELMPKVFRLVDSWQDHDFARQGVIANMAFNLGINGLSKFKLLLAALDLGLYKEAAKQMKNSLWAKQVKGRADELELQMITGKWAQ